MTNITKTPLIGTGLNGLVGSRIVELLSDEFEFLNLDINHPVTPIDITDQDAVVSYLANIPGDFIIHCAAFTDVTKAWEQSGDQNGIAYHVNVNGTAAMVNAARQLNRHLIHLSTAYVFDGKKDTAYTELDQPNPIEWYGQTKLFAEELITDSDINWTILRIDQPFRQNLFPKLDIAHRILNQLKNQQLPPQFQDHHFGPTVIEDLAMIIKLIVKSPISGIFHATSGESWTDYDFSRAIAQHFFPDRQIISGSLSEYLKTSQRPYQANTALNIDKLKQALPSWQPTAISTAVTKIQI